MENTAVDTRNRILGIRSAMESVQKIAREKAGKAYSKDLVELIFRFPYCKISFLMQEGIAGRQTASSYLQKYEEIGVLQGIKEGREIYYINRPLLEILRQ